jgi:AcrR family transcriptional regulator
MAVASRRQSPIESSIEKVDGADPEPDQESTPERLLNTAERLFVEKGYDAVTARMINAEAGCNPAAIHYHFGSKERLVTQLLETRLLRDWEAYKHGFSVLERRVDPTVEEVVDLAVTPLAQRVADGGVPRMHVHLLARVYLGDWDVQWKSRYFDYAPWVRVLHRARPDLSMATLRTRWDFAVRLNLSMLGDPTASRVVDRDIDTGALIAFITAGLARPA